MAARRSRTPSFIGGPIAYTFSIVGNGFIIRGIFVRRRDVFDHCSKRRGRRRKDIGREVQRQCCIA